MQLRHNCTEERAWLGDVSAVVLQQSLLHLDATYKNFFDTRQSIPVPTGS
ncbi:hypothetical protein [Streptomyces sp. NPDC002078]